MSNTMSRIRFATAREVFEAFPTANEDISTPPSDAPPLDYLLTLSAGPTPDDAISFCAYLLPRREAVWWAGQCVRDLIAQPSQHDEIGLRVAADWVEVPEEQRRRAALNYALNANQKLASTWVAFAAAWSGGAMILHEHAAPPAPPHLTAKAARAAVMLALAGKVDRAAQIAQCVERAVYVAEN
jgi:hypothetical protein